MRKGPVGAAATWTLKLQDAVATLAGVSPSATESATEWKPSASGVSGAHQATPASASQTADTGRPSTVSRRLAGFTPRYVSTMRAEIRGRPRGEELPSRGWAPSTTGGARGGPGFSLKVPAPKGGGGLSA